MDKFEIAKILDDMAIAFEIKGENPFKIRAYQNAARVVEGLEDFEERVKGQTLTEVKGIGQNLSDHITELFKTGKIKEYEKLRKSIPSGVFDILNIPGVGPKKAKFLWEKLGATGLGDLELICRAGGLRNQKGFGEKTENKILQGIAYLRKNTGKHLYSHSLAAALEVFEKIANHKHVSIAEICGSLRRKREVIGDIDVLAASKKPSELINFFTKLTQVESVTAKGDTRAAVVLKSGINCDLRVVSAAEFPFALHYFTGNKEHNIAMRSRAQKMGMKLNEYGLFKVSGKKETLIPCKNEEELFKKFGLEFIPPEMRENTGEMELAENGKMPKLVEEKDIKGVLHVHSKYSDGINTIEEMARFAKSKGYSYLAICDHSRSAAYAGGMEEPNLKKQWKEIDSLNKKISGFKILKGIEVDIMADGSLDYPEEILKKFDIVIASIHSRFSMNEEEMTARIVKALENPHVNILGHPTGRLLLSREGYKLDIEKVIDAAAANNVALEINSNPHRLDLDWRNCAYARSKGAKIAICPDAHTVENILDIMFGVGIARKGWLTKEDVVNAWELDRFLKWIDK